MSIDFTDANVTVSLIFTSISILLSLLVLADLFRRGAKTVVFYLGHAFNILTQVANLVSVLFRTSLSGPFTSNALIIGAVADLGGCLNVLMICFSLLAILDLFAPFAVSKRTIERIRIATLTLYVLCVMPNNILQPLAISTPLPSMFFSTASLASANSFCIFDLGEAGDIANSLIAVFALFGIFYELWQTVTLIHYIRTRFYSNRGESSLSSLKRINSLIIFTTIVDFSALFLYGLGVADVIHPYRTLAISVASSVTGIHLFLLYLTFILIVQALERRERSGLKSVELQSSHPPAASRSSRPSRSKKDDI